MSEQIAFLRKKGGGLAKVTEKVLWTNPSPSENFAAQDITLSDDIDNYDYVAIKYAYSTVLSTGMCIATILATSEDVKKWEYNAGVQHNLVTLAVQNAANTYYSRTITCKTNTSLRFGTCYQMATNTTSNSLCIPLQILGVNIATDDKYTEYEIVELGSSARVTTTTTNVALNDDIDNYAYLAIGVDINMDMLSNNIYVDDTGARPISYLGTSDYIKHNNVNSVYVGGGSGSMSTFAYTIKYVDNTHFQFTRTNTATRAFCVYGIKATRKEVKKPEKYDILPFKNLAASTIPTFTTKGRAKAIWLTFNLTNDNRVLTITNVNPTTGVVDNNDTYANDTNNIGGFVSRGQHFVVTDNTVSLDATLSSYALRVSLAYTYE